MEVHTAENPEKNIIFLFMLFWKCSKTGNFANTCKPCLMILFRTKLNNDDFKIM